MISSLFIELVFAHTENETHADRSAAQQQPTPQPVPLLNPSISHSQSQMDKKSSFDEDAEASFRNVLPALSNSNPSVPRSSTVVSNSSSTSTAQASRSSSEKRVSFSQPTEADPIGDFAARWQQLASHSPWPKIISGSCAYLVANRRNSFYDINLPWQHYHYLLDVLYRGPTVSKGIMPPGKHATAIKACIAMIYHAANRGTSLSTTDSQANIPAYRQGALDRLCYKIEGDALLKYCHNISFTDFERDRISAREEIPSIAFADLTFEVVQNLTATVRKDYRVTKDIYTHGAQIIAAFCDEAHRAYQARKSQQMTIDYAGAKSPHDKAAQKRSREARYKKRSRQKAESEVVDLTKNILVPQPSSKKARTGEQVRTAADLFHSLSFDDGLPAMSSQDANQAAMHGAYNADYSSDEEEDTVFVDPSNLESTVAPVMPPPQSMSAASSASNPDPAVGIETPGAEAAYAESASEYRARVVADYPKVSRPTRSRKVHPQAISSKPWDVRQTFRDPMIRLAVQAIPNNFGADAEIDWNAFMQQIHRSFVYAARYIQEIDNLRTTCTAETFSRIGLGHDMEAKMTLLFFCALPVNPDIVIWKL